jgi:hypothetical protein
MGDSPLSPYLRPWGTVPYLRPWGTVPYLPYLRIRYHPLREIATEAEPQKKNRAQHCKLLATSSPAFTETTLEIERRTNRTVIGDFLIIISNIIKISPRRP